MNSDPSLPQKLFIIPDLHRGPQDYAAFEEACRTAGRAVVQTLDINWQHNAAAWSADVRKQLGTQSIESGPQRVIVAHGLGIKALADLSVELFPPETEASELAAVQPRTLFRPDLIALVSPTRLVSASIGGDPTKRDALARAKMAIICGARGLYSTTEAAYRLSRDTDASLEYVDGVDDPLLSAPQEVARLVCTQSFGVPQLSRR